MNLVRVVKDHLIFEPSVENYRQIETLFPTVRVVGNLAAVPLSLDATILLRNLGYAAPAPIRTQYRWPIRPNWGVRPHQVETAEFFTIYRRCYCHSSMRVGKTLSALWAADYLRGTRLINKILVIAPLSSLERSWGDEIFFNLHHLSYTILHGSAEKRRKLLAENHDIYVINHDGVEVLLPELKKRADINLIILDEAHEYSNSKTKKWKVLRELVTPEMRVWALTGTPTPQDPTQAYGQMKLITPENYRGSFTSFKNTVMVQMGPFKWIPRNGHEEIIKQVLSPSIRFERSVVTDMEPCLIERHAELSAEQKLHYNALVREATTEIDGTTVTAINAAALAQKLLQACTGVIYSADGEFLRIDFGPRLKVIEELIEENYEKVLVFVPFTGALEAVAAELRKRWTVAVVDGGVSAHKRAEIFKNFQQAKDPHVIVAHPGTMAYSLELTAASLIIWYAPCVSGNKIYEQACARIDGGGQKVKIDIAHVYGTTAERKIYASLRERGRLQAVITELLEHNF